tara:strand:+ start:723 stop:1205 length:483 start_codon:yes stop_codon:yes gene_type:complete
MNYLIEIELGNTDLIEVTPEIMQEREIAIFDLLEKNSFKISKIKEAKGPFRLNLKVEEKRLIFDIYDVKKNKVMEFQLSLAPFRQVVKDYYKICTSYYEAVNRLPPSKIETIDMARRGIHDEGARVLISRLDGKITLDQDTARRLFTLISVINYGVLFEV